MNAKEKHTKLIKAEAKRLGFLSCGMSQAGFLEEEAPRVNVTFNVQFSQYFVVKCFSMF